MKQKTPQVLIINMDGPDVLKMQKIIEQQCRVRSMILNLTDATRWLKDNATKVLIFAGGLQSIYDRVTNTRKASPEMLPLVQGRGRHPTILGICYGAEWLLDSISGGEITQTNRRCLCIQAGLKVVHQGSALFEGTPLEQDALMGYGDKVVRLPWSFKTIARRSGEDDIAAMEHLLLPIFGIRFYPENEETPWGYRILRNLILFAGCEPDY